MIPEPTKKVIGLRTYAGDLEAERKKQQEKNTPAQPKKEPIVVATKVKSVEKKPTELHLVSKKQPEKKSVRVEIKKPQSVTPIKPPAVSGIPKAVPNFSELQQQVSAIRVGTETNNKPVPSPQKPVEPPPRPKLNIGYETTIITDRKGERFRLIPATIESLKKWLRELGKKRKRKQVPTYSVPEAERRKGIIQEATTKTGAIFTADNETLKEQIRRRNQKARLDETESEIKHETPATPKELIVPREPVITTEPEKPETVWTPFTEHGYDLLTEKSSVAPTAVVVEFKKRSGQPVLTTTQNVITTVRKITPSPTPPPPFTPNNVPVSNEIPKAPKTDISPMVTPAKIPEVTEITEPVPKTNTASQDMAIDQDELRWKQTEQEALEEITETPDPVLGDIPEAEAIIVEEETPETPVTVTEDTPSEIPEPKETIELPVEKEIPIPARRAVKQDEPEPKISTPRIYQVSTNALTLSAAVIILVIFTSIVYLPKIIIEVTSGNASVDNELIVTKALMASSMMQPIVITPETANQLPSILHKNLLETTDPVVELPIVSEDGTEITPSYLFKLLNFQTLPSLRQSITNARFISIQNAPVILLNYIDQDTVRGGMFDWENTMPNDLVFLFDTPPPTNTLFTDDQVMEIDVRVLKQNDRVLAVYGFVGDKHILIAKNYANFEQVAKLLTAK